MRPRIGTDSSYLLQILGSSEIRSIPALLHEDNEGEAAPSRRTWIWTHVGHGCVVGRYEYTRHYRPATANPEGMRLLFDGRRGCHESVSAMERSVSLARPEARTLVDSRAVERPLTFTAAQPARPSSSRRPELWRRRRARAAGIRGTAAGKGCAPRPRRHPRCATPHCGIPGCGTDGDMLCLPGFTSF